MTRKQLVPIEKMIITVGDRRVILSPDLARIYGVEPRVLVQAVKRNIYRFPGDFMFQLTKQEHVFLRSQNVILSGEWGRHSKYLPYAFTEHGAIMAKNVLNSRKAVSQ